MSKEEEKQASSDKRYNSILKIIDKHLVPDEQAKKDRGEVFTPPSLVREMLFGLRKSALEKGKTEIWGINENGDFFDDKESDRVGGIPLKLWRDPETKWLDPANGIGNFPVIAYYMLDYQLGEHGPSEFKGDKKKDKRRKHIIEKMLYMIELDKGNCATSRSIFKKIDPEAKPNLCCSNSLNITDEKLEEKFNVNRFDVIMGNPPFTEGGTKGEGKKIWPEFIDKFLNNIKDNGFLVYITPTNWRNIAPERKTLVDTLLEKIKEKDLQFVYLLNSNRLRDNFPRIQQPMDYYIIQNKKYSNNTTIVDHKNTINIVDISDFLIIPNYGIDIFFKFNKKLPKLSFTNIPYNISSQSGKKFLSKIRNNVYKYPIIKSILKNGVDTIYSSKEHPYQNKKKILVSDDTNLYPTYDNTNGTSQHVFSMIVDNEDEGYKIIKTLNSKLFQYVLNSLKIIGRGSSVRILNLLPKLDNNYKSELDIFSEFNINKTKINEILNDKDLNKITIKSNIRNTRKAKAPKPESGGTRIQKFKHKTRKNKKSFFGLF
jgi:Eco57I restriction-modification methylase